MVILRQIPVEVLRNHTAGSDRLLRTQDDDRAAVRDVSDAKANRGMFIKCKVSTLDSPCKPLID